MAIKLTDTKLKSLKPADKVQKLFTVAGCTSMSHLPGESSGGSSTVLTAHRRLLPLASTQKSALLKPEKGVTKHGL